MIKQRPVDEKPAADRTGFFIVITLVAAVAATVVARKFTAQFLSYLPGEPRGCENVRAHLAALDIATSLVRVIGSAFFGMFGVKFLAIVAEPLTEISLVVACLASF